MAVRVPDGGIFTLRPRAGDYVRSVLAEQSGVLGDLGDLDDLPGAACSTDVCRVGLTSGGRNWRILATRSHYMLPFAQFRAACAGADIVVSDRRLPPWCSPHWFKADGTLLARSGGLAVSLRSGRVETVAEGEGRHPWVLARLSNGGEGPRAGPARARGRSDRAAVRSGHWRDRGERAARRGGNI